MGGMRISLLALAIVTVAITAAPSAQPPAQPPAPPRHLGPVVPSFGGVFDVPDPGLMPPKDQDLKLRFDVNVGPEPGELNHGFRHRGALPESARPCRRAA